MVYKKIKLISNIKFLRLRGRLTRARLGELISVNPKLIESWENGRSEPQLKHLPMLSVYFKVSIDYLVRKNLIRLSNKNIASNYNSIKRLLEF